LVSDLGPIPKPPVDNTASTETITEGQQLFSRSCAICHANTDMGLTPDLRRMDADTHEGFLGIVLYGARRYQGMPQWDDVLNEDQANAIHAYLTDLAWRAFEAQENSELFETAPDNMTGH
ncbi:MAG: cytochrome c, partial [Gammaproteobacteria bacterium]